MEIEIIISNEIIWEWILNKKEEKKNNKSKRNKINNKNNQINNHEKQPQKPITKP